MTTHWSLAHVIVFSLVSSTFARPDLSPRANVRRVIWPREACYDDDVLWSFQHFSQDSVPYCSSLLGIQDRTETVSPVTSYTTTSTLVTTDYDIPDQTITIPAATVSTTTTTTITQLLERRNVVRRKISCTGDDTPANYSEVASPIAVIATAPFPTLIAPNPGSTPITSNPVPSLVADGSRNASIASYVYSACSCLRITPQTVDFTPTVQSTRTVDGIDYEVQPTITSGTTTVTATVSMTTAPSTTGRGFSGTIGSSSQTTPNTTPPFSDGNQTPRNGGAAASTTSVSTGTTMSQFNITNPVLPPSPPLISSPLSTGTTMSQFNITNPVLPPSRPPFSTPSASSTVYNSTVIIGTAVSNFISSSTSEALTADSTTYHTTPIPFSPSETPSSSSTVQKENPSISNGNRPGLSIGESSTFSNSVNATTIPTSSSTSATSISSNSISSSVPNSSTFTPTAPPLSPSASIIVISNSSSVVTSTHNPISLISVISNSSSIVTSIDNPISIISPPPMTAPSSTASANTTSTPSIGFISSVSASSSLQVNTSITPSTGYKTGIFASPSLRVNVTSGLPNSTLTSSPTSPTAPVNSSIGIGGSVVSLLGCPSINNTIYNDTSVTPPQTYQIQCWREYTGPSFLGLEESNFADCIAECDKVNLGFSELECYGTTWLPFNPSSIKCLLKTEDGMGDFKSNNLSVSAVLLSGVAAPVPGEFGSGLA